MGREVISVLVEGNCSVVEDDSDGDLGREGFFLFVAAQLEGIGFLCRFVRELSQHGIGFLDDTLVVSLRSVGVGHHFDDRLQDNRFLSRF
jgi:hypothetical protein